MSATQCGYSRIRPHGRYPVFHWRSFWPMGLREADSLPPMRAFTTFRAKPPRQALATRDWSSYHLFYHRRLESVHSRVTASGKPGDAAPNDEHVFIHRGFPACRRYKESPEIERDLLNGLCRDQSLWRRRLRPAAPPLLPPRMTLAPRRNPKVYHPPLLCTS